MFSVDRSRSIRGATDELHDCGPCKAQGRQGYAQFHCQQCSEFLCAMCKEQHKSFKVSRDHNVIQFLNLEELKYFPGMDDRRKQLCSPCEADGHSQTANHYCRNCSEYFCNACLKEHQRFKISKNHEIWTKSTTVIKSHKVAAQPLFQSAPKAKSSIWTRHSPPEGTVTPPTASINHHDDFLNLKPKSSRTVNVKLPKDNVIPRITSCEFLHNGELLLVDHYNSSLKLLDKSLKVKDSIYFTSNRPWDAAELDNETVLVTFPHEKMIQYIQICPNFMIGTSVVFDNECLGVSVGSGNIYITCHDNDGKTDNFTAGDIRVLDARGNELNRIGGVKDGEFRFLGPDYIAVSGNVIYVSDRLTNRITALKAEDEIIFEYCSEDMKAINALCVDSESNILVCAYRTQNVQVITAAGRKDKNLLISSDNIKKPEGMAYRPCDGTLVVGCKDQEDLLVYKLG